MQKLIILALMLFTPTAASAQELWLKLPPGENGKDPGMYLRQGDVLAGRPHQTSAKLWIKYDMTRFRSQGYKSAMALYKVNCRAQTTQQISRMEYMVDGSIRARNIAEPTEVVVPETHLAAAVNALCRAK